MRPGVYVRVPPVTAHLLIKLSTSLGDPPAAVIAKLLASNVPKYASQFGIENDWEEVQPDALELLPRYLSEREARRYVRRLYGD